MTWTEHGHDMIIDTRISSQTVPPAPTTYAAKPREYSSVNNPNPGTQALSLDSGFGLISPVITRSNSGPAQVDPPRAIQRTWDRWGNLLSQSDAENSQWRTTYTYNASNQVTSETKAAVTLMSETGVITTSPVTTTTQTYYDQQGRVVAVIDANTKKSRFTTTRRASWRLRSTRTYLETFLPNNPTARCATRTTRSATASPCRMRAAS
jgi:YD repeat-containing protein